MTADGRSDLHPFDIGLQPERTALAWRRTALALVIAAIVGVRVLPGLLDPWALIPAGSGIILAVTVLHASHRRYGVQHQRLTGSESDRVALPGGFLLAIVSGIAVAGGVACIAVVVITSLKIGESV